MYFLNTIILVSEIIYLFFYKYALYSSVRKILIMLYQLLVINWVADEFILGFNFSECSLMPFIITFKY